MSPRPDARGAHRRGCCCDSSACSTPGCRLAECRRGRLVVKGPGEGGGEAAGAFAGLDAVTIGRARFVCRREERSCTSKAPAVESADSLSLSSGRARPAAPSVPAAARSPIAAGRADGRAAAPRDGWSTRVMSREISSNAPSMSTWGGVGDRGAGRREGGAAAGYDACRDWLGGCRCWCINVVILWNFMAACAEGRASRARSLSDSSDDEPVSVVKSICRCACDSALAARRGSSTRGAACGGEGAQGDGGKEIALHGEVDKEKRCGCPSDAVGLRPRGRPCVGAAGDEDEGGR